MQKEEKNIDLFKRTCIIKGSPTTPPEPEESEILTPSSTQQICEEEQCLTEESLNVRGFMDELECMKRRIQKMQLLLKMDIEKCPEESSMDFELLLNCSQNKEICELQKNHYKLQCQIKELIRCLNLAKEQIADLRIRICEKSRDILDLQKMVASLLSWRNDLEHEFGVCIERFEYLKHVKAEWKDVEVKLDALKADYAAINANFVSKECFLFDKRQLVDEMTNIKELFRELFDVNNNRFMQIEYRLDLANIPPFDTMTKEFSPNNSVRSGYAQMSFKTDKNSKTTTKPE